MLRLVLALLLLLQAAIAAAQPLAIAGNLRVIAEGEEVRVRLAMTAPLTAPPTALALGAPRRLAIDLPGASSLRRETTGAGPVAAARVSQFDPKTVRIVLDLAAPMAVVSVRQEAGSTLEFLLRPVDQPAFAALVRQGRAPVSGWAAAARDREDPGSSARLAAIEAAIAEAAKPLAPPPPAPLQPPVAAPPVAKSADPPPPARRPPPRGPLVVVLDAGHGGTDPGAPAVTGGQEKEVTLAIALATRRAIERRARQAGRPIEVRLTRDDDRFVTLGNRVRLARQWNAALFLSIHADSAPNPLASGASVYTLSETASDREAARVAAKENRADIIAGVDLGGESRDVAGLLIDLGLRDSMNASADFAQTLQRGMSGRGVPFRTSFHRFAGFQVLRNLGVPAVLLETGFLSNEEDSRRLQTRAGEQAIADGIADAVIEWSKR